MILTGNEIKNQVASGKIKIYPFSEENLSTNSYDLHLGDKVLRYTSEILDPYEEPEYEIFEIPDEGLELKQGVFLLASTVEQFGGDHFVPLIHNRSGVARMGLFVHITADLIDIGAYVKSTLQLYATLPCRIYKGMPIAQVSFWVPKGEIKLYDGKYSHGEAPIPSRTYLDYVSN